MSQPETRVRVITLAETASTNSDAMARAIAGEELPCWVVAERQTAGKGRSGRTWQSLPGNLQASLAIRVSCRQQEAAQLSLVAGVAIIRTLRALAERLPGANISTVRLKWPNDVLAGDAKLGGILIETTGDFARGGLISVIGFGLNVVSSPQMDRKVTHLSEAGLPVPSQTVHEQLSIAMDEVLRVWDEGKGFSQIRSMWLDAATPSGTPIAVNSGGAGIDGVFLGLDDDGALLMRDAAGLTTRVTFGDVTLLSV